MNFERIKQKLPDKNGAAFALFGIALAIGGFWASFHVDEFFVGKLRKLSSIILAWSVVRAGYWLWREYEKFKKAKEAATK